MQPALSLHEGIPGWTLAMSGSIKKSHQPHPAFTLESTNLLVEENCHKPHSGRESPSHNTREGIRVVLQKLAVTEQAGEPFRRM